MEFSSYLNWFKRLVVLGAIVAAGVVVSTAGAVGRPPDIQDLATAKRNISRPPDIGDVAARLSASVPDLFERYAAAHPYGRGLSVTPTTLVTRPPDVQDTAGSVNAGSPSGSTLVSRPPDLSDTALALRSSSASRSNGFGWSDWGIGIGTGMGLALLLGVLFLTSRQLRQRMQPA
jgi:hypothetical protein